MILFLLSIKLVFLIIFIEVQSALILNDFPVLSQDDPGISKRSILQDQFTEKCIENYVCYSWTKQTETNWYLYVTSNYEKDLIYFRTYDYREKGITFSPVEGTTIEYNDKNGATFRAVIPAYSSKKKIATAIASASNWELPSGSTSVDWIYTGCDSTGSVCIKEIISSDLKKRRIEFTSTFYCVDNIWVEALYLNNSRCTILKSGYDPNVVIRPERNAGDAIIPVSIMECTSIKSYLSYDFFPFYRRRLGSTTAKPKNFLYDFPFIGEYEVVVNNDTDYPYTAIFDLPEGTEVYSMRNGIVVDIEGSNQYSFFDVCPQPVLTNCTEKSIHANYVLIRHLDGSIMWYYNLEYGSIYVVPGQIITEKTLLARSGKTGWTPNGPVLTMYLTTTYPFTGPGWYDKDYVEYKSQLITFNNGSGYSIVATVGNTYKGESSYPPGTEVELLSSTPANPSLPLNSGIIVGIVFGILIFILFIISLIYFLVIKKSDDEEPIIVPSEYHPEAPVPPPPVNVEVVHVVPPVVVQTQVVYPAYPAYPTNPNMNDPAFLQSYAQALADNH